MSEDGLEPAAPADEAKAGPARVVLRGVRAVVLDDLPPDVQVRVLEAAGSPPAQDVWSPVAARAGTMDGAVKSYSGQSGAPDCRHGKYKAVPYQSWFVPPIVIEPALS